MPNYYYECPSCGHEYHERRETTDPQWFTRCDKCKQFDYVEVTK